jgi:hypothetical protein
MTSFIHIKDIYSQDLSMNKNTYLLYLGLFTTITHAQASYFAKNGIRDIALAYCITAGTTFLHEAGHVAAFKLLYGKANAINIGGSSRFPTAASLPGLTIRWPLLPFVGFTSSPAEARLSDNARYKNGSFMHRNKTIHAKNILSALAGPIVGALSAYACLAKLNTVYPNKNEYPVAKLISKGIIAGQLAINLIPTSLLPFTSRNRSDGDFIFEALQAMTNKDCAFYRQKTSLLYRWFGI